MATGCREMELGAHCWDGACCCPAGFTGVICEEEIIECESDPCMNGGTCIDEVNGYTCECPDEYIGKYAIFVVPLSSNDLKSN